jgi:hypothetical protein
MKRIGSNEFFATLKGAKTAGSRRGYRDGAKVLSTEYGFCLLALGEGADDKSYRIIQRGDKVAELRDGRWQ